MMPGRTSRCCGSRTCRAVRMSRRRSALAAAPARAGQQVAVIGYPARDSRVPDEQLMQSIFGDVYDKKRLAPGQVTEVRPDTLLHDCSTVGGNSGSVLVDLATGEAIGLHFAGRFLEANYAVPATVVAARLERLRRRPGSPAAPSPVRPPRPQAPLRLRTRERKRPCPAEPCRIGTNARGCPGRLRRARWLRSPVSRRRRCRCRP